MGIRDGPVDLFGQHLLIVDVDLEGEKICFV